MHSGGRSSSRHRFLVVTHTSINLKIFTALDFFHNLRLVYNEYVGYCLRTVHNLKFSMYTYKYVFMYLAKSNYQYVLILCLVRSEIFCKVNIYMYWYVSWINLSVCLVDLFTIYDLPP